MHNSKYAEYQKKPQYIIQKCLCKMHKSLHLLLLLSKYYTLGMEKRGIKNRYELGTEELKCTSLCTTTMHIELYVCILLLLTSKLLM